MRRILFRGRRIDNGEWIEGYLFQIWSDAFILWGTTNDVPNMIKVDPSTVSQYTGFRDRNRKKIFEGDIIEYVARLDEKVRAEIKCGLYDANDGKYNNGFYTDWYKEKYLRQHLAFWARERDIEVIGNIHDNPKLMGVQA